MSRPAFMVSGSAVILAPLYICHESQVHADSASIVFSIIRNRHIGGRTPCIFCRCVKALLPQTQRRNSRGRTNGIDPAPTTPEVPSALIVQGFKFQVHCHCLVLCN